LASGDWVAEDSDREWLPDIDIRSVVDDLPPGVVDLDDASWEARLPVGDRLREIRVAVRGLGDADTSVVEESLTHLGWLLNDHGNTTVAAALVVPTLLRAPARVGSRLRAEMLQLAGHLARMDSGSLLARSGLLLTMHPVGIYDPCGYLENLSVEAVRVMVGRDSDLLTTLMRDHSPEIRGRAAYVLAAAKPVTVDLIDVMRARLAVESDPAVQTILVLCIAQVGRDQDRISESVSWAHDLWSDPAATLGIRLGGIIAWLGLTPADPPPQLQRLRATIPMPVIGGLLKQLPWISALRRREDWIANWWQRLANSDRGFLDYI
jgi:hypothetical protein